MKKIKLTQGQVALVDNEDYECLNKLKWYTMNNRNKIIPVCFENGIMKKMSRLIMYPIPDDLQIDHINGDPSDNRRSNLRLCTNQQNAQNRGAQANNKSGYKGVSWHKHSKKWQSQIKANDKVIPLGYFDDPIDAAKTYNEAAIKYHGEFARINIIDD